MQTNTKWICLRLNLAGGVSSRPSSAWPTDPAKRAADLMLNYHLAVTGKEQSAVVAQLAETLVS